MITQDEFFDNKPDSRLIFDQIENFIKGLGEFECRISKSQIVFHREKPFAWLWIPGRYLHGKTAPLVLTIGLRFINSSPRWKSIIEPYPGRFTHHLELFTMDEFDEEVKGWLRDAWKTSGNWNKKGQPGH